MSEAKLLISRSPEVELEMFVLAEVLRRTENRKYGPDDIKEIYHGESNNADALIAWGLINHHITQGKTMMLIFNPDQQLPDQFKKLCK